MKNPALWALVGIGAFVAYKLAMRSDALDPRIAAPTYAPLDPYRLNNLQVPANTPMGSSTYPFSQPQAPRADQGNQASAPWYQGPGVAIGLGVLTTFKDDIGDWAKSIFSVGEDAGAENFNYDEYDWEDEYGVANLSGDEDDFEYEDEEFDWEEELYA